MEEGVTHNGINGLKLNADEALVNAPQDHIASPSGGSVIDIQARATIDEILAALEKLKLTRNA